MHEHAGANGVLGVAVVGVHAHREVLAENAGDHVVLLVAGGVYVGHVVGVGVELLLLHDYARRRGVVTS